jgi:hypothetical protein
MFSRPYTCGIHPRIMTNVAAREAFGPVLKRQSTAGSPLGDHWFRRPGAGEAWWVLTLIEGLTGILMCDLSTGVCWFAVVNRIDQAVRAATS